MKEEKPMLQNQSSTTSASHKSQLLKSDGIDIALTPHIKSSSSIIVAFRNDEGDDKERYKREISDTPEDANEEEEDLVGSPFSNGGESGRERLKRHRVEVAGKVWIPDTWGQEDLLKDWIDCSAFDSSLMPMGLMSARDALAQEARRALSGRLEVQNSC